MSVIEGMAYGRAVAATPVGAVEDIVKDGETGLIVPCGDAAQLARCLDRLVDNEELCMQLGQNAYEFARENLDVSAYVVRLSDIWLGAAEQAFGGRRD
jgi:glycosyltransferase involved in cell wall biosynthesis